MGLRLRIALLMCLAAAAAWSAVEAYESLKPPKIYEVPEAVYAEYTTGEENAQYQLKACDGYVAVYGGRGGGKPMMTDIELSALASADRAMIELGIPVKNREELLLLLEDLGS
ncbi:MAG: hypothetical protein IJB78_01165 [Oscillospiraceae bacterium]|nr:hypothetical protein [Oscillospiraceae bacterium]